MIEQLTAIFILGLILAITFNYDALLVLRSSGSQGVGTETGTGLDLRNDALVKAVCHVTVVGASGTLAAHLEGSDDDSTYYDIPGGVSLDPADGAAIDAVGKYEIYVKTAFRYVRIVGVVATAAITWESFLATAER